MLHLDSAGMTTRGGRGDRLLKGQEFSPFIPLQRRVISPICNPVFVKKPLLSGCLMRQIRKRTKLYDLQAESVVIIIVLVVTAVT